jgi:hypothetical protein
VVRLDSQVFEGHCKVARLGRLRPTQHSSYDDRSRYSSLAWPDDENFYVMKNLGERENIKELGPYSIVTTLYYLRNSRNGPNKLERLFLQSFPAECIVTHWCQSTQHNDIQHNNIQLFYSLFVKTIFLPNWSSVHCITTLGPML